MRSVCHRYRGGGFAPNGLDEVSSISVKRASEMLGHAALTTTLEEIEWGELVGLEIDTLVCGNRLGSIHKGR